MKRQNSMENVVVLEGFASLDEPGPLEIHPPIIAAPWRWNAVSP
jgi:hypothetical protein